MSEKIPQGSERLQDVDLGPLAGWIEQYRTEFGAFARQIRAGLLKTEEERERGAVDAGVEPGEAETMRARAAQEDIIRRNATTAEQTGLALEFPSGDEEQEWALELRLNIGDGEKFRAYLASLQNPTESQVVGLIKVADVLTLQLTGGYDLENPDDERLINLVVSLKGIVTEYARLAEVAPALKESAVKLEETYASVKGGYLKELIAVQEAMLLEPLGKGFGPSQWHTDSTEDGYITMWNDALEILSRIKRNPKATALHDTVRAHLLASLEYAWEDMKARKSRLLNNKMEGFIAGTKERLQKA